MSEQPEVRKIHIDAGTVERLNRRLAAEALQGPINPEQIQIYLAPAGAFYRYAVNGQVKDQSDLFVPELREVKDEQGRPGHVVTNPKGECIRAAQAKYPKAAVQVMT